MELSDFAIIKLVPFVTGDNNLSRQRKGAELVELFCSCGYRDIYRSEEHTSELQSH